MTEYFVNLMPLLNEYYEISFSFHTCFIYFSFHNMTKDSTYLMSLLNDYFDRKISSRCVTFLTSTVS